MAKTREQKEQIVKNLEDKLSRMKSLIFSDYFGLTVKEMEELRKNLREKGGEYFVVPKTLLGLALKNTGMKDIDIKSIEGGMAVAFGFEDEIAPAKVLAEFSKKHEALKINGGILENAFIPKEKVLELAKLPTKIELIAKVVGSIKAPLSGLVGVCQGILRGLIGVLANAKAQK